MVIPGRRAFQAEGPKTQEQEWARNRKTNLRVLNGKVGEDELRVWD